MVWAHFVPCCHLKICFTVGDVSVRCSPYFAHCSQEEEEYVADWVASCRWGHGTVSMMFIRSPCHAKGCMLGAVTLWSARIGFGALHINRSDKKMKY